ncbi:PWWP domain-containing protein 2 [Linum perenne]
MSGGLDEIDLNADGASGKPVKGELVVSDSEATVEVAETLVDSVNGLNERETAVVEEISEVEPIDELKDAVLDSSVNEAKVESGNGGAHSDTEIGPADAKSDAVDLREEEARSEKVELNGSCVDVEEVNEGAEVEERDRVSKDDEPTMMDSDDKKLEVDEQETDSEDEKVVTLQEKKGKTKPVKPDRAVSTSSKGGRSRSKFGDSDLVWAKVRSHPWWPGQMVDASMASDKAKKYMKKERYLIAYFGDQSFAWNETSKIKPFRPHFSQLSKQSNLEDFHDAVDDALDEVSRRVEFGLSCPCVAEHNQIKTQVIVNPGVKDEYCRRDGGDKCSSADSFQPEKLVECIKRIGLSPLSGVDRLEFVTARAQLLAFSRFKGYPELPELQVLGTVVDEVKPDVPLSAADLTPASDENENGSTVKIYTSKRKRLLVDGEQLPAKKERTLADFIAERRSSLSNGKSKLDSKDIDKSAGKKKRKAADSDPGYDVAAKKSQTLSTPEGSKNTVNSSRPNKGSFGIGYSILKVASQMNSASPILKSHNVSSQKSKQKKGSRTKQKKGSRKKSAKSRRYKSSSEDDYSSPTEMDEDELQSPTEVDEDELQSPTEMAEEQLQSPTETAEDELQSPTEMVEEQLQSPVKDLDKESYNLESPVSSPAEEPDPDCQELKEEASKLETEVQDEQEEDDTDPTPEEENPPQGNENGEARTPIDE